MSGGGLPPEIAALLAAWGAINPGALAALHALVRDELVRLCLRHDGDGVSVWVVPRDERVPPYCLADNVTVAIDGPSADTAVH